MAKEALQLHNLDKGIEKKYGSIEHFVEEGQENKIEESMASIEEVETKFKQVQENADKDGRGDEEKKKIIESLVGFNNQKNKISHKERLERDGFTENDPSYETDQGVHKVVKMNDGTKQHWRQKENGDYFLKKIVEGDTSTHFNELGEITQQNIKSGEVMKGANNVERTLSNNQELFDEPINPENYIRIRKNPEKIKLFEQDAREKFKTMNALAQGSPEREQAYNAWKLATEKVKEQEKKEPSFITSRDLNNTSLEKETKDAYTKDETKKKLEIQSQGNPSKHNSLEDAQIAEELEDNLRGKYRAQVNPETYNKQSQTPMESWIEREEQSQNISSPEAYEKGPLARALEQDKILNKGDKKVDDILSESKQPKESLAEELDRQKNKKSLLENTFKGMGKHLGNLKESLVAKNPKLKNAFEVVGTKTGQFNRWMNNGNQAERFAKRVLISGSLGLAAGLLTGGAGTVAALAMARGAGSFVGGAGAGLLHKKITARNFEKLKGRYHDEVKNKQNAEYQVTNPEADTTLNIRDRKEIRELRTKRAQGTITDHEKLQLEALEQARSSVAKSLLNSRNNYRELHQKLLNKNERNNRLVSIAGGILGGLSMRAALTPELWDSLTNHPDVPENVPKVTPTPEPIPEPVPEVIPDPIVTEHIVSGDAFINKGEGITHALARQINASPELQAAFGLDGPANGQELAEIAKKLGYINEDGSDVRVMMGHGAAYELRIDPNTGEPFVMEYKGGELEGGNYVGGEEVEKHMQGENFEAKARDSYEYIHDGSPQSASSGTERVNFSAKEMYPDIDFDSDLNPRIPNATDIESHGPIGANGEELVRNSQTSTPESGIRQSVTENTPTTPEKRILLQQQAAGVEIRHTTLGTELHPIKGFQFTGEIDNGDFSPRELKFLERGIGAKGYQTLVSFDPTLPPPFAGTHLIQLKNGQYALEKVSFGGSGTDAQAMGEQSMKSVMKAFGMPGDVEHFGPTTMPKANIYESHAFVPLSDEQAKFIRESYATLNRALTNVPR